LKEVVLTIGPYYFTEHKWVVLIKKQTGLNFKWVW